MDTTTPPCDLHVHGAAHTDMGKRRTNNEDSSLCDPALGLYIVADGMGGHAGGEVASRMAVEAIHAAVQVAQAKDELRPSTVPQRRALLDWLARTIDQANAAIYRAASEDLQLRGMGCTLDVALVIGSGLFLAHVGDSRVYHLHEGGLHRLTEDHSLGQMLLSRGVLTPEEAARHPQRNVLTRAMGPYPTVEVDTSFVDLSDGDVLLLCSDGLYNEVPAERIQALLSQPPPEAVHALVEAALAGDAPDNITAVVFRVDTCQAGRPALIGSESTRHVLAGSPFFAGFTQGELVRVQKIALAEEFAAGEAIQAEGAVCEALYVLVEGRLSVWRDEQRVTTLSPGDPFGAMGLSPMPADVSVKAETAARVLSFPLDEVQGLYTSDTIIAAKLASAALQRTAARMRRLLEILTEYRRAARELAALG